MIRAIALFGRMVLGCLVLSLMLSVPACGAQPNESTQTDPIRIENVCVSRLPGYTYQVVSVVDFWLVHASKANAEAFTVYVGNNPDLRGGNAKYKARALIDGSRNQLFQLGPPQEGQVLGVPKSTLLHYFHLLLKQNDSDYSRIVRSVRFCQ